MPAGGSRYYVLLDGHRTECMYVQQLEEAVSPERAHLVAVPPLGLRLDRDRIVRPATTSGEGAETPRTVPVRFALLRNTSGLRVNRKGEHVYEEFRATPRLDDLEALVRDDQRSLPFARAMGVEPVAIFSDADLPDHDGPGSQSPSEADSTRAAPGPGGAENAAVQELLREMKQMRAETSNSMQALTTRVSSLELAGPRRVGFAPPPRATEETGTFADLPASDLHAALDPEHQRTLEALRAVRPPGEGLSLPRVVVDPQRSTPKATPAQPPTPLETLGALLSQAQEAAARRETTGPGPYRSLGSKALGADVSKLYKMEGARGAIAKELLENELDTHPRVVIEEFEEAVRRQAPPEDPSERDIALGQLQRAWRTAAPAKDHTLAARVGEAIVLAYHHLRNGRASLAQARLALLLAGLEQGLKDNGKYDRRTGTLSCMPEPPLREYEPLSSQERERLKSDKGLGELAVLVGRVRATTARAVYLENRGA